jgi:hypothetical protein
MFGLRVEAKLVEMLASTPLKSSGGPIPINLVDDVVLQGPEANTGVSNGVMGEDQGLTMGEKVLARGVVADRVSLPLEIMVLAGSVVLPGMITPYDASVPVVLIEIGEIATTDPDISEFISRDEGSPG